MKFSLHVWGRRSEAETGGPFGLRPQASGPFLKCTGGMEAEAPPASASGNITTRNDVLFRISKKFPKNAEAEAGGGGQKLLYYIFYSISKIYNDINI